MKGKLLGVGIVGFWVAMMAALLRVEYAERGSSWNEVPVQLVLLKVLGNPDPLRFRVYYQKQPIGYANAEFVPIYIGSSNTTNRVKAYRVQADVNLTMQIRDEPIRFTLHNESVVTRHLDVTRAKFTGNIGGTQFSASTAASNGSLSVSYDLGDGNGTRQLAWSEAAGMAWAKSLGMPATAGKSKEATKAYHGRYSIAGNMQRAFLVEIRVSEAMWVKMWVDESGSILQLDSSAGFALRADVLDEEKTTKSHDSH